MFDHRVTFEDLAAWRRSLVDPNAAGMPAAHVALFLMDEVERLRREVGDVRTMALREAAYLIHNRLDSLSAYGAQGYACGMCGEGLRRVVATLRDMADGEYRP
jgi:hypothetical protein